MLLGELFYYDKQLDTLSKDLSNIQSIDVLGINTKDYNPTELRYNADVVASDFIRSNRVLFKENSLDFNYQLYLYLSSFSKNTPLPAPKSTYQESIINWIINGYQPEEFHEILKDGKLVTEEEDFVLYYTFRFLSYVLDLTSFSSKISQISAIESANLSKEPQVVVITEYSKFPLFHNLNIEYLDINQPEKKLLSRVEDTISKFLPPLLLIDETHGDASDLTLRLKKKYGHQLIISSFSTRNTAEDGFFDKIVKDTLGVRLV